MGDKNTSGFTIIETMLFLAISGVLIVTLLAGTGVSINIQRYRDAVETFKSMLQDQYSDLTSVKNERDDTWSCNQLAQTEQDNGTVARGQSDCVLIGKYMTIVGGAISSYTVTAREKTNPSTASSDVEKIATGYVLNVSTVDKTTTDMEWGTKIAWPTVGSEGQTGSERSMALLFIRSPESGLIYTFTGNNGTVEPTSDILNALLVAKNEIPGQKERVICIDSSGLFTGNPYAVVIGGFANGPSAVETRSNDLGGDTQC